MHTVPDPSAHAAWYLVHTKPRQETCALTNLERQGYRCYLPQLRVQKIRRGRVNTVPEPLFPRYLFVHLDSSAKGQSWAPIRSTTGVNTLIHFGNQPARVDEQIVDLLRTREQAHPGQALFNPGDTVHIQNGPFAGMEAVYQMANGEQRALVLIELLSKPCRLAVDTVSLRKVDYQ
jgi:transcriptional antiterminator RfaH